MNCYEIIENSDNKESFFGELCEFLNNKFKTDIFDLTHTPINCPDPNGIYTNQWKLFLNDIHIGIYDNGYISLVPQSTDTLLTEEDLIGFFKYYNRIKIISEIL